MTVVLDESAERVLLIWRHRFIIDRWMWELPGGYMDQGEDGITAAAQDVEEETGYRPRSIEPILTFQPMTGSADSTNKLYMACGADRAGAPLADEAEEVRCIPLAELPGLIAVGDIVGAATIIGAQHAPAGTLGLSCSWVDSHLGGERTPGSRTSRLPFTLAMWNEHDRPACAPVLAGTTWTQIRSVSTGPPPGAPGRRWFWRRRSGAVARPRQGRSRSSAGSAGRRCAGASRAATNWSTTS
jgi:8-oxo-dGTP pyrophosphatase MutT (NUDIX family)